MSRTKASVKDGIVLRIECPGSEGYPWDRSTTLIQYEPGNGTRYVVLFVSLSDIGPAGKDAIGGVEDDAWLATLMSHPNKPSMVISKIDFLHWSYAREKFGSITAGDAMVLAELIGTVVGCEFSSAKE